MIPDEMSLPQTTGYQHKTSTLLGREYLLKARLVNEAITPRKASGHTSPVYADAQIGKKLIIAPLSIWPTKSCAGVVLKNWIKMTPIDPKEHAAIIFLGPHLSYMTPEKRAPSTPPILFA
jgi:hypothetical protein